MYTILQDKCLLSDGNTAPEFCLLKSGVPILRQSSPYGTTVGKLEDCSKKLSEINITDMPLIESLFSNDYNQTKLDKIIEKYSPSISAPISMLYRKLHPKINSGERRINGIISNFIGGKGHHNFGPDFTEIMLILPFDNSNSVLDRLSSLYRMTREEVVKKFGNHYTLSGLEGSFVVPASNEECVELLLEMAKKVGSSIGIGIDVAAVSLSKKINNKFEYIINGIKMNGHDLIDYYISLLKRFPEIIYIEDPFHPDDLSSWKKFYEYVKNNHINLQIAADDLVASNTDILRTHNGMFSSVVCKINQAGTITNLEKFINSAKKSDYYTVMSQRSIETDDDFLIDLGLSFNCDYFKLGAPSRERIIKYNALFRKLR